MDFCLRCELTCRCDLNAWAQLLEAWLALTSVKYLDNLLVLILLKQWLNTRISNSLWFFFLTPQGTGFNNSLGKSI